MSSITKRSSAKSTLYTLIIAVILGSLALPASADWKRTSLSDVLDSNGFSTLKLALEITGLLPVLESNRVTVFAPTDDVFEATAQALGCTDALDLATRLIDIPVGDSDALSTILTYHATLRTVRSNSKLLRLKSLHMVNGDSVTTGVNAGGLYVKGEANATASNIVTTSIQGSRFVVSPIDQILLPFAPPADLCGPV